MTTINADRGNLGRARKAIKQIAREGGSASVEVTMHPPYEDEARDLARMAAGSTRRDLNAWSSEIGKLQAAEWRYPHVTRKGKVNAYNYGEDAERARRRGPQKTFVPDPDYTRRMARWAVGVRRRRKSEYEREA